MECKLFKVKNGDAEFALIRPQSARYVAMYFCYDIDLDANQYGSAWTGKEVTGTFFLMTVTINERNLTKLYSHLTATDLSLSGVKELMYQSSKVGMVVCPGMENLGVQPAISAESDTESVFEAVDDEDDEDLFSAFITA